VDGRRPGSAARRRGSYELLDGILLVSPAPSKRHQRAVKLVFMALESACPTGFEVFFAPLD